MDHGLALTFDDAYLDDWLAARPIFEKYGARVTFFVAYVPNMASHDVLKLHQLVSAGHEIGYHSVSHAHAVETAAKVGIDRYIADEIIPGIEAMQLFGLNPTAFAYPFNARTPELDAALYPYFQVLRARAMTVAETLHPPSGNRLLLAKGCDMVTGAGQIIRTVDDIENLLFEAEGTGKVAALYGHGISDRPVSHHFMSALGLEHILATARKRGFEFMTASELA